MMGQPENFIIKGRKVAVIGEKGPRYASDFSGIHNLFEREALAANYSSCNEDFRDDKGRNFFTNQDTCHFTTNRYLHLPDDYVKIEEYINE